MYLNREGVRGGAVGDICIGSLRAACFPIKGSQNTPLIFFDSGLYVLLGDFRFGKSQTWKPALNQKAGLFCLKKFSGHSQ